MCKFFSQTRKKKDYKKKIAPILLFCYTTCMANHLFAKRVIKQNKGKKCSCAFAYNFADN